MPTPFSTFKQRTPEVTLKTGDLARQSRLRGAEGSGTFANRRIGQCSAEAFESLPAIGIG